MTQFSPRNTSVSKMASLPKWLLCLPMVVQWLWLGLRHGSLTLPSTVNASILTGGLAGESKLDCLALIAQVHAPFVATTQPVPPGANAEAVRARAGLQFPLIAKPDIGWCGWGVCRIDDAAQLAAYAASFPAEATFLLQEYLPGPLEAGLFYQRGPHSDHGRLTGITLRHQPHVIGDGVQCVADLAAADPNLAGRPLQPALQSKIPRRGEIIMLSTVASLRVGGRYENGWRLQTAALEARLDEIARSMPGFHFGRFDVRFASEAALQAGDFRILEINGAGSEAIQFFDSGLSLIEGFRGVFRKQTALFALAAQFRALGHRPVGVLALSRAWLMQQRLIARYPASN
jgi:hypothetical protein